MLLFVEILAVLFIAYWSLELVLYFMQPVFLYSPVQEVPYTPEELGLDFEKVIFKSDDGLLLSGWYIPAKNLELTVLFCRGKVYRGIKGKAF